jgi:hypothetical protein
MPDFQSTIAELIADVLQQRTNTAGVMRDA